MNKNLYIVILAGGKGERLWPLSRDQHPKQLLSFLGRRSLLELTIDRIAPLIPKERRGIVTTVAQEKAIKNKVHDAVGFVISEPVGKNTAPAILLVCQKIYQECPTASIAFLPADHYIPDYEKFQEQFSYLEHYSHEPSLVLFGVKPTYPATGYGYIEYNKHDSQFLKRVVRFHEKPNYKTASLYCQDDAMVWNTGIFYGKASLFIEAYQYYAPTLYNDMNAYLNGIKKYEEIENISIDYALMEKGCPAQVLPVHFAWSDVGNLDTFLSLIKMSENKKSDESLISLESTNNIVHNSNTMLTVLIGVEDLCIVQTHDVLLIARRDELEKVKMVLSDLKNKKLMHYL